MISLPASPVQHAFDYLQSPHTRGQYTHDLGRFFVYVGLSSDSNSSLEAQAQAFLNKAAKDKQWVEHIILSYIKFNRDKIERKEITPGTAEKYFKPIKAFYGTYEGDFLPSLNWKRIKRALPRAKNYSNDRAPTIEEIQKLIDNPIDRRLIPIVLVMASSGIRVGAWDSLQWKHVTPITNDKKEVIAAKLLVYNEEYEQYTTFVTPEAYHALKEYLDLRSKYGEKITPESWLIRDKFKMTDVKLSHGKEWGKLGLATIPKKLPSNSIKTILERAYYTQGIREELPEGKRRFEFKGSHGFRKFFKTNAQRVMSHLNTELLMGHSIGLSDSYYKPLESDLLNDYLKAVPLLTVETTPTKDSIAAIEKETKEQNEQYRQFVTETKEQIQRIQSMASQTRALFEQYLKNNKEKE